MRSTPAKEEAKLKLKKEKHILTFQGTKIRPCHQRVQLVSKNLSQRL